MADYKVVPDGLAAFGVEVTSAGSFRSVRGFPTTLAAWRWIAQQIVAELQGLESEAPC